MVLRRLGEGLASQRRGDTDTLAGEDVSQEIATLVARDLARRSADGAVHISRPGRAFLQRQAADRMTAAARRQRDEESQTVLRPYRVQHQELDLEIRPGVEGHAKRHFVDRRECPLSWLVRRKDIAGRTLITDRQYQAGMRFRDDFERGGLSPRVTSSWSGLPVAHGPRSGGGMLDPTESQVAAQTRFRRAASALGPGLADVAIRVCCGFEGLESVERTLSWPARSGKVVLALALDRLAEYYKIG
jgi:hypothetical protein